MAQSVRSSPNAFPAEVARYLALEPGDVQELVKKAKLPALKIPKKTRTVIRIPLRDFHAWLQARTQNPTPHLAKYETFLADFDAAVRHSRPDQGQTDE
jgi:excisionase family DNA binding protein